MLEDIRDGNQSHLSINRREAFYKIRNCIKRSKAGCKEEFLSMQNMGKGLHKVFKAVANDFSPVLPILGEYGSEVSYFVPEPGKSA